MSHRAQRFQTRKRSKKNGYRSACKGKVRFRSREHAVEALVGFRYQTESRRQEGTSVRIPVRVYQCLESECNGGYHLTSKPLIETSIRKMEVVA
jgi:hypothetical protein